MSSEPLPVDDVRLWLRRPDCGAVVVFEGLVRDHSVGRPGVSELEYEAYDTEAVRRFEQIAATMRERFEGIGRIAIVHRVGVLGLSDVAVVVGVSTPHRDLAFDACRFGIDTLKASVPIWKRETWEGGEAWGVDGSAPIPVPGTESE